MAERYDIHRMLAEIKEDEHFGISKKRKVSQDEIKGIIAQRRVGGATRRR